MSTPGPLVTELATRTLIAPGIADLSFKMVSPAELSFRAGQFVSIAVDGPGRAEPVAKKLLDRLAERRRRHAALHHPGDPVGRGVRAADVGADRRRDAHDRTARLLRARRGPRRRRGLRRHRHRRGRGDADAGRARPRRDRGRRYLYWGLRHETDLFAHDEIARLCERSGTELRIYLSAPQENDGWGGCRGRITPAILAQLPSLTSPTFYLVGNGAMITELKRELVGKGVNRKKQIRTEAFFD